MNAALVRLSLVSALALCVTVDAQRAQTPKLAVLIMADQMRADYIDRFGSDWSAGLKRLLTEGARFTNALYPYLTTVTCAGHATVATGAFPHVHGIQQNAWYDRASRRQVACTDDESVRPVRYAGQGGRVGHGARRLVIPTLADELRRQRGARVVSLSLKARSAIMMAGHGGDAVIWRSDALDAWESSTMFSDAATPAVKAFLDANPIAADYGRVWNLLLPEARYPERDDGDGEAPPKGWTNRFPHVLKGDADDTEPDEEFFMQWERSPMADAYLGRFGAALVDALELGTRGGPDVLAISFSAPDLVGHAFGPASREVRDVFAHLDRTLGILFDHLDRSVGRDSYVVALSADHGVSPLPEQTRAGAQPGGRLNAARLTEEIERFAAAAVGPGRYVTRISGNDVYFEPGMYERLVERPAALHGVLQLLSAQSGIARVFTSAELRTGTTSSDQLLRAAALSYVAEQSGDLVFALRAGYMFAATGTTHGNASVDDQHVPLLFLGPGVKAGVYGEPATPADLAPTVAALFGISLPHAEGRVLRTAIR
jgi:predicted AlkP superfamily pyrophosphatase or phosphodiesterase